ncbi:prepilin peptidase, partial [Salmonella enterica]|nr:prepilin peptidase [Salmonella enterica]EEL2048594.1 prepilin peptidase [Salmonella enterica]
LLILMAPQVWMTRIGMLFMCSFLLQLGVMDATSGWLPRPFTAACLCSGLLFCLAFHREPELRFMETAAMAVVMGSICHGVNRRRPQLGVGDVWLVCALVGWMGVTDALQAAFFGLSGFMLWQWIVHRDFLRCGVLGPWLCAGCIPVIVDRLYQPEWILR